MKKTISFVVLSITSLSAIAQPEVIMSKQEFIDSQIGMFEKIDELKAQMGSKTDDLMKSKLSPEDYQNYKKESDMNRQEEAKAAADCLGVSVERFEAIQGEIGSKSLIASVKSCSSKLPESITLTSMDWSQEPKLADFNSCNQTYLAKQAGVPLDRFKRCSAEQQEDY